MVPSASSIAGMRYLSASSNALERQVGHLLHGGGREDDHVEVAVAGALVAWK
jgi:hypothetical protein